MEEMRIRKYKLNVLNWISFSIIIQSFCDSFCTCMKRRIWSEKEEMEKKTSLLSLIFETICTFQHYCQTLKQTRSMHYCSKTEMTHVECNINNIRFLENELTFVLLIRTTLSMQMLCTKKASINLMQTFLKKKLRLSGI